MIDRDENVIMCGTRNTEKQSWTNSFKTHKNVLAFNKICGFGKMII